MDLGWVFDGMQRLVAGGQAFCSAGLGGFGGARYSGSRFSLVVVGKEWIE